MHALKQKFHQDIKLWKKEVKDNKDQKSIWHKKLNLNKVQRPLAYRIEKLFLHNQLNTLN